MARRGALAREAHSVARGALSFQRAGAKTALRRAYADSPLRLLTPRNHGPAAWVYTATLGGGLVGGDRILLELELEAHARAFVSTQGPTRVYRGEQSCESEVRARVGAGALLLLLPDPVACFAGAAYRQHTQLELGEGASVACWDVLTAGRVACGERWAFRRYRASLTARREGRTLLDDALLLEPAHGPLAARLGPFDALATMLLAGPLVAEAAAQIRARIDAQPLSPGARLHAAASPIGADALLVRLAARSIEELLAAMRAHFAFLPSLLGDDPWARRM